MREGGVRSVHFPSAARPAEPKAETPKELNVLEVFANALRDVELIREKLRGLLTSENRHGDLQGSASAVKRIAENLAVLIEHEEQR